MGVHLEYVSGPVARHTADGVLAEARLAVEAREWWIEPLFLQHEEERLVGWSKLHTSSWVAFEDSQFMTWRDLVAIVDQLSSWSARDGIGWELRCEGETIGHVRDGRMDMGVASFIEDLARDAGGVIEDDPGRASRVRVEDAAGQEAWDREMHQAPRSLTWTDRVVLLRWRFVSWWRRRGWAH